jgi:hypothetical protein
MGASAGSNYHALMYYSSELWAYTFGSSNGGGAVTGPSSGSWFHAAGIWNSSNYRYVYYNGGDETASDETSRTVGTNDQFRIGVTADSTPLAYMDGLIAEAALWNVALSAGEIRMLGDGFSPLMVRPQSLVLYVPLVRDNDDDLIGGLSLTASGSPTIGVHPRVFNPYSPIYRMEPTGVGAITVNLDTATLTANGQALTLAPGAVTTGLNTATLIAGGQATTIVPGAATIALATALLTASGQALSVVTRSGYYCSCYSVANCIRASTVSCTRCGNNRTQHSAIDSRWTTDYHY